MFLQHNRFVRVLFEIPASPEADIEGCCSTNYPACIGQVRGDSFLPKMPFYTKVSYTQTVQAQARESRPQTEAACDLCPKIFSSKKHLKRHQDMKHPAEMSLRKPLLNKGRLESVPSEVGDVFKCQVCDKNFTSEEKLERHGKEHLKGGAVLPFPCEKCDKSFISRKRLKKHMRSHMDLTHQCDVCEKSFQNAGILSLHKNIHLDQKPFKCESCDKDFSQKGNLKTHMMKHHGQELSDSIVVSGEPIIEETVSHNGDI